MRTKNIQIHLVDERDHTTPVQGAGIYFLSRQGSYGWSTDADGYSLIEEVPYGDYTVRIVLAAKLYAETSITVNEDTQELLTYEIDLSK